MNEGRGQTKGEGSSFVSWIQFQIAIKTAITAFLGWTVGSWFTHLTNRPNSLISGLWCTLTAIVVLQTHLGGTYKTSWIRFLGVVLGSLVGALCTNIFGSSPLTLGFSVLFVVMLCFILNLKESIRIACLSVTVVMVLWGLQPTISPWTFAFFRSIDSILGILIAVLVAHLLWPFQAKEMLKTNLSHAVVLIRDLFSLSLLSEQKIQPIEDEYNRIKLELDNLLLDNVMKLEETKIELWSDQELYEEYQFLQSKVQYMRKLVITLGKVYEYTKKIVDSELIDQLQMTLHLLDQGLIQLSHYLIDPHRSVNLNELSEAQKKLTQELLRFRSQRLTRQFDLLEVEGFYVFFYNLDVFLKVFFKLVEVLKKHDND